MAQTGNTGALAGRVKDPTDAVVPAAAVYGTSVATGEKRHVITGSEGAVSVPLPPPGVYAVTVAKSGFSKAVLDSVAVNVTETADVDARLELRTEAQSVEVGSVVEVVQTDSSALGRVVSEHTVESLPLVARNYTQVIGLSPGVTANITNAGDLGRGSGDFVFQGGIVYGQPNGTSNTPPANGSTGFNNHRLLESVGNVPPAESEAAHYAVLDQAG